MGSIRGYIPQVVSAYLLNRHGQRILGGLLLMSFGSVMSFPVFIGNYGPGISWWPILIFVGFAWFLSGLTRFLNAVLRRR